MRAISKTLRGKKALPKKQKEGQNPVRKSVNREKGSEVWSYLIILLVLIPYFFCFTDVTYQMFGCSHELILSSEGEWYDEMYVHDQESYGARWIGDYSVEWFSADVREYRKTIYADFSGSRQLISQGGISPTVINYYWLLNPDPERIDGYIYLRYRNVAKGKLIGISNKEYNMTDYQDIFASKNEIYDSGCSKILR